MRPTGEGQRDESFERQQRHLGEEWANVDKLESCRSSAIRRTICSRQVTMP
jgi:hypothetical protein